MDKIIKNYEEVLEKPISTRQYLKFLRHKWESKRYYKKSHNILSVDHNEHQNNPPENIEVVSFAIVLDDVVVDVMNVQKEFGDILSKGPKFIALSSDQHRPHIGWIYKDGEFITLEEISVSSHVTRRG